MKKVGIFTLPNNENYGNVLQNYAVQATLQKLGCKTETVNIFLDSNRHDTLAFSIFCRLKLLKNKNDIAYKRILSFNKFYKCINNTSFSITGAELSQKQKELLKNRYDYFVCGSDQVWNPYFCKNFEFFFLPFIEKDKKLSFSASIGLNELPAEFSDSYKKWLSDFKYISVREETGAKIVKELTGNAPTVLLDPTFMLTKKEWNNIAYPASVKPSKPYMVVYALGELDSEYQSFITDCAKANNLEIVSLVDLNSPKYYSINPAEFIDLIKDSSMVITDSFHCTVFSIIYSKQFVVLKRQGYGFSMLSRIDALLNKFHLENRYMDKVTNDTLFNCTFADTDKIILQEQNKIKVFLQDALNNN